MALRSYWSGSLSIGLVTIPVKVIAAASGKTVRFNQLRAECGHPVGHKKVCKVCDLPAENLKRGYQLEGDEYLIIEDDELEALAPVGTSTIEVDRFVDPEDVDPVFHNGDAYLAPGSGGERGYAVLAKALEQNGAVGLGSVVMRGKGRHVLIRVHDGALVMTTLLNNDEVRKVEDLDLLDVQVEEKMVQTAGTLIDSMREPFDPTVLVDHYREKVEALIESKRQGVEPEIVREPEPAKPTDDLMAALEASLEAQNRAS